MSALRHVLWIGGPPASGKTTIAGRLARRHGLRWYNSDTQTWSHRDRAIREGSGAAVRWEAMTPEERWVTASPAEMFELSLHAARGRMVVDDLRRLPITPLIVAEGTVVAPEVVSLGVADRARAVWLIPTPKFQRDREDERGGPPTLGEFHVLLARTIEEEARDHDAPTLFLDGSQGVDELTDAVEETFAEALGEGPCLTTRAERRALLREANEAVVEQVRAYCARPWADTDADRFMRRFVCECGDSACEAIVEAEVGVAAREPVLAPGHDWTAAVSANGRAAVSR
jgi:hypothetical protein